MQDDVARHFEKEIADEKGPGANRVAELKVVEHLQLGEADIDPIEIGDEITYKKQGNEPPSHFRIRHLF